MTFCTAIIWGVCSCGGNDDEVEQDGNGGMKNEKKLIEMSVSDYNGSSVDKTIYAFNYDRLGRLITAVITETDGHNPYSSSYAYQWTDGSVVQTHNTSSGKDVDAYQIVDGLLRSGTSFGGEQQVTFSYSSDGRLSYYDFGYDYQETVSWGQDGRLLRLVQYGGNLIYSSGKTCKGYNPYLIERIEPYVFAFAQPALLGIKSNQLPDKMQAPYGATDDGIIFDYKLDKEGYLEEITATFKNKGNWESGSDGEVEIYNFKWQ